MVPLFIPGVPGGPEILILLFLFVLYIAIPLLVIVAVFNFLDGKRGYDRRIEALERRVERLEDERSQ